MHKLHLVFVNIYKALQQLYIHWLAVNANTRFNTPPKLRRRLGRWRSASNSLTD